MVYGPCELYGPKRIAYTDRHSASVLDDPTYKLECCGLGSITRLDFFFSVLQCDWLLVSIVKVTQLKKPHSDCNLNFYKFDKWF